MKLSTSRRTRRSSSTTVYSGASADVTAALPSTSAFDEIDKMIGELAGAGALDEGNKRALDGLIASWETQHRELLAAFHLDLAGTRDERIKSLRARITVARQRLESAQRAVDMLDINEAVNDDADRPAQFEPRAADHTAGRATETAA